MGGLSGAVPELREGVRIVGMSLSDTDVGGLRQDNTAVFLLQSLSGCAAVEQRDTELAGEPHGKSLDEERFEESCVFHIGNVEQPDDRNRAIDGTPLQGPARVIDLEHPQAIHRQRMGDSVLRIGRALSCGEPDAAGRKGPSARAEHLAARRVVVHIAEA